MQPRQAAAPGAQNEVRATSLNGHGLHRPRSSGPADELMHEEGLGADERDVPGEHVNQLALADRRKDEFLASLSHELRGPLASIRYGIGVLLSPNGADVIVQRGMRELIEGHLHQLSAIAGGVHDVARITSGRLLLQPEHIDLQALLSKTIEALEPDFARRTQALVTAWPASSVCTKADVHRVEQLFVTLLTNASKYSDFGGIVALSLSAQDRYAIVRVKDSGIGISPDALPHIFDVFMQADVASLRLRSGMGTGLSVARRIVESHGGRVTALSAGLGQGSELIVQLPLET
jgi:signal transduction histidine kinase